MTSTSSSSLLADLMKIQDGATEKAAEMLSDIAKSVLLSMKPYLPWLILGLTILLVLATLFALAGRTRLLGRVLYHYLYFGIIAIVIWIFGFGILFNAYIDILLLVLYGFCFWVTGLILSRLGNYS